jgi:two-component system response regulator DegU
VLIRTDTNIGDHLVWLGGFMAEKYSIIFANKHPLVHLGFTQVIESQENLVLIGIASDKDEAQHLCLQFNPNVLLLDSEMTDLPLSDMLTYIRQHSLNTKVISLGNTNNCVHSAAIEGADGCILKTTLVETFVQAVLAVANGQRWFSGLTPYQPPELVASNLSKSNIPPLTAREQQIFHLLSRGLDNYQIAKQLCLAKQTVCNYISRLYRKINVLSRSEAIILGRELGFGHDYLQAETHQNNHTSVSL